MSALAGDFDGTGTYELFICKRDCAFANSQTAIAKGVIVLFDRPLSREEVGRLDPLGLTEPGETIRACFSGTRAEHAETYAFIDKTGATTWSFENSVLRVVLFHSPDAGYGTELRVEGDTLLGNGGSWGAGAAAPSFGPDVIVGRRIGPPNFSACLRPPPN